MRLTIIPEDGRVVIGGVPYTGIDLSFIPSDVHAIQWYDTWGEIERKDPVTFKMVANDPIDDITPYQAAVDLWDAANTKAIAEAEAAAVAKAAREAQEALELQQALEQANENGSQA